MNYTTKNYHLQYYQHHLNRVRQANKEKGIDENIKYSISLNALEAILEDDDEKLIEIVAQLESDPNGSFEMVDYKVPSILKMNPPFACLCCFFGSEKCYNALLDLGCDINKCDEFNRSPIHFACAGGNLTIIRSLDQSGFDFNAIDKEGLVPAHYAAMAGHLEVIQYLWTKGCDINAESNYNSMTPLQVACLYGSFEVSKFIVDNITSAIDDDENDDTKQKNMVQILRYRNFHRWRYSSPLHMACEGGNAEVLKYLLDCKNKDLVGDRESLDRNSRSPLLCACHNGSLECVKCLVEAGVSLDKAGRKHVPLVEAAAGGFIDIVAYLLKQKGVFIRRQNSQKVSAIMAAVANRHCDIVELLIQKGAIQKDDSREIGELFLLACGTTDMKLIETIDKNLKVPYSTISGTSTSLYVNRTSINLSGDSTWGDKFMQQACILESIELCQFLLKKNVNFDHVDLRLNVKSNWSPFMDFITKNGADLAKNTGVPPIVSTIKSGNLKRIKDMIEKGAKLDKKIIEENNCIELVCDKPKLDTLKYLLSYKPKLTNSGKCLNMAVMTYLRENRSGKRSKAAGQCIKMIELLLEYGADPEEYSDLQYYGRQKCAVESAVSNNCMEIVELFDKQGVDFTKHDYSYHQLSNKDAIPMLKFLESKGYKFESATDFYYNFCKKTIPIYAVLNTFQHNSGASEVVEFLLKYTTPQDLRDFNYWGGNIVDLLIEQNSPELMLKVFNKLGRTCYPKRRDPIELTNWAVASNLPELIAYVK